MVKKPLAVISILSIMVLSSCKTTEFGWKVIPVNGMLYDFSNKPVPNYTIALGEKYTSLTDINGRFLLPRIPVGEYTITGRGDGYESYQSTIAINDRQQIIYIRIPTYKQLLSLADEAMTKNQLKEADAYITRAYRTGGATAEVLFYLAAVRFRQRNYYAAARLLEIAAEQGVNDMYVDRFLDDLKRMHDEKIF
ncbi:hypothetical protein FACS189483_01390 [Spirochaetia bacterium]|nr:hypothetical protein FACS189483_01390 [Spirochaetia bacterium]